MAVAESSWPAPTYNSGAVSNAEYEQIHAWQGGGMVGPYTETQAIFADSSGRQIKVRANRYGFIRGYHWYSGTGDITMAISANSSGSTRTDRVVLRLDRTTWTVRVAIINGTPGAGAPTYNQGTGTTGTYEISLATVTVANNASTITSSDVTWHAVYFAPPPMIGTATSQTPLTANTIAQAYVGQVWTDPTTPSIRVHNGTQVRVFVMQSDSGLLDGSGLLATGWSVTGGHLRYQQRNGNIWVQWDIQRTGANLTTGSTLVFTLPAGYRPLLGFFQTTDLTSTTGNTARLFFDTNGQVNFSSMDAALNTSGYISGSAYFPQG